MALNKKQQRFVEEYLIDLNATQAAIRAGYSPNRASEIGYQLLQKTTVKEEVDKAKAERSRRTGITQDRVIQELARIGFCKITDVADSNGKIKDNASEDDLACIESIKVKRSKTENGAVSEEREVKIASKVKCLELLGKHLGMWNDKTTLNVSLPVVISGEDDLEE